MCVYVCVRAHTAAIAFVEAQCVPGKSVAELCAAGDELINKELAPKYKGKKVEKGIAFPTCLSLNNCCGHFSPLKEDSIDLKEGDVVKMCVCSLLFFLFLLHTPQSHANYTHEHNGYNRTQGWPRRKHGKGFNTTAFANVHWRWGDGTASV